MMEILALLILAILTVDVSILLIALFVMTKIHAQLILALQKDVLTLQSTVMITMLAQKILV
jgi:hypothetical protein